MADVHWTDAEIRDALSLMPDGSVEVHEDLWEAGKQSPKLRERAGRIADEYARKMAEARAAAPERRPTTEEREELSRFIGRRIVERKAKR